MRYCESCIESIATKVRVVMGDVWNLCEKCATNKVDRAEENLAKLRAAREARK